MWILFYHKKIHATKSSKSETAVGLVERELCIGRESNPGQLLGRQLCSPLYHQCTTCLNHNGQHKFNPSVRIVAEVHCPLGLTNFYYEACLCILVNEGGSMVKWLALWTLNPVIRVQISVEPSVWFYGRSTTCLNSCFSMLCLNFYQYSIFNFHL